MDYALWSLALIGGLVILIKGADFVVDSASIICKKLHISPLIIGLTVIAIGTSLPELAVGVISAIKGESSISFGNVIGSNISNIALIFGLSLLILPVSFHGKHYFLESIFFLLSCLLLLVFVLFFGNNYTLTRYEGAILLVSFITYTTLLVIKEKRHISKVLMNNSNLSTPFEANNPSPIIEAPTVETQQTPKKERKLIWVILILILGLAGVVGGGILVTNGASFLAEKLLVGVFKVSHDFAASFIGLTIVAVGTSLPELITTISACKKGQSEMGFGNIVGSNIANIFLILGVSSLINPLTISKDLIVDTVVVVVLSAAFFLLFRFKKKLGLSTGIALLSFFILYYVYLFLKTFGVISF
jgi:cation:H+ antiporter